MDKVKKILYWLSIVSPIVDVIKGAIRGIYLGIEDIKEKKRLEFEEQQKQQFWKDNNNG